MPARVRRDDQVKVISGKDKGNRVFVEGLNIQKRHQRPRSIRDTQRGGEVGGVIEKEGPIHISNVMPLDPKSGDPTRVGTSDQGGRRVRRAHRSGEVFE